MRYASVSIVLASVVVACNSDGRYLAEENAQQALSVSITISGRLTTGTGLPIAGNRVVLAGAKSTSVLSDAAGGLPICRLTPRFVLGPSGPGRVPIRSGRSEPGSKPMPPALIRRSCT